MTGKKITDFPVAESLGTTNRVLGVVDGVTKQINTELIGGDTDGCVRYDGMQTLTDEQKAQARSNIGASSGLDPEAENGSVMVKTDEGWVAADGYGYPGTIDLIPEGDYTFTKNYAERYVMPNSASLHQMGDCTFKAYFGNDWGELTSAFGGFIYESEIKTLIDTSGNEYQVKFSLDQDGFKVHPVDTVLGNEIEVHVKISLQGKVPMDADYIPESLLKCNKEQMFSAQNRIQALKNLGATTDGFGVYPLAVNENGLCANYEHGYTSYEPILLYGTGDTVLSYRSIDNGYVISSMSSFGSNVYYNLMVSFNIWTYPSINFTQTYQVQIGDTDYSEHLIATITENDSNIKIYGTQVKEGNTNNLNIAISGNVVASTNSWDVSVNSDPSTPTTRFFKYYPMSKKFMPDVFDSEAETGSVMVKTPSGWKAMSGYGFDDAEYVIEGGEYTYSFHPYPGIMIPNKSDITLEPNMTYTLVVDGESAELETDEDGNVTERGTIYFDGADREVSVEQNIGVIIFGTGLTTGKHYTELKVAGGESQEISSKYIGKNLRYDIEQELEQSDKERLWYNFGFPMLYPTDEEGTYTLKAEVSGGEVNYYWEKDE